MKNRSEAGSKTIDFVWIQGVRDLRELSKLHNQNRKLVTGKKLRRIFVVVTHAFLVNVS